MRRRTKYWLQRHGLEVVLPPDRRVAHFRHARLRRFHLPPGVDVTGAHGPDVLTVDLDRMANRIGFGYGTAGWHPFVAALEEHLQDPGRSYPDTVLASFYQRFRPSTIHEVLLGGREVAPGMLATWPTVTDLIDVWAVTRPTLVAARRKVAAAHGPLHTGFAGPSEHEAGATHLARVVNAHRRIASEGYRPDLHGYITGHFLRWDDDYRFVVGHGNHRMAAVSLLGYRRVPVRLRMSHAPVVDRSDLHRWTRARGGLLESHEPPAILARFFDENGRARARALGLLET